jgi:hypothetical protein
LVSVERAIRPFREKVLVMLAPDRDVRPISARGGDEKHYAEGVLIPKVSLRCVAWVC